jgi:hypothetical protein
MGAYSYNVTSTASDLTGGAGQPPDRQGTLRRLTVSNPLSSAVKIDFYDSSDSGTLTTAVSSYITTEYVSADAYGAYKRGAVDGDGNPILDASGTPVFNDDTIFDPPTSAPAGSGLPSDAPAEAQDYKSTHSVYSLHKYPGVKTVDTVVPLDATTPLVPFYTLIVPANTVLYSIEGPWMYVSGLVAQSDNASAVVVVAQID